MFLDIGIGMIISLSLGMLFRLPVSGLLILTGILFALLPDLDFVVELLERGRVGGKKLGSHRNLTHYPLTYIPVAGLIFFFFGPFWSILFFACSLVHFIHDSIGMGWGIQWLWPFRKDHFKFFEPGNALSRFSHARAAAMAKEHGDEHWIANFYLKWNRGLVLELAVLLAAVILLLFVLR